jgi:hypothetical protein
MIQMLPEAALRHAGSTSDAVFVQERYLRVPAVCLQKVGINITCQTLQENVGTNELVSNESTPHVYGRATLGVASESSV